MRQVLYYGVAGGVLIAVLKYVEYQHLARAYPTELYGGVVAIVFTVVGIQLGLRWTRRREAAFPEQTAGTSAPEPVAVMPDAAITLPPVGGPFVLNSSNLKESGLTPRELEILGLIAQGLSNREIAEKLFVSENTVKTHSSRVFEKLGVNRRVQAVQRGKDLGLIP